MYIQLEDIDFDDIAEQISECSNRCGGIVSYSDLGIQIEFDKIVEEHRDTDYYNGTGAWITDSVDFTLGDITCDGVEVKYNHKELEKFIKVYLWNR